MGGHGFGGEGSGEPEFSIKNTGFDSHGTRIPSEPFLKIARLNGFIDAFRNRIQAQIRIYPIQMISDELILDRRNLPLYLFENMQVPYDDQHLHAIRFCKSIRYPFGHPSISCEGAAPHGFGQIQGNGCQSIFSNNFDHLTIFRTVDALEYPDIGKPCPAVHETVKIFLLIRRYLEPDVCDARFMQARNEF